jgi:hypothetical protein
VLVVNTELLCSSSMCLPACLLPHPVLQALSQLSALKKLHLQNMDSRAQCNWLPPSEAYKALTASSSLQHLEILNCPMPVGKGLLLPGAWGSPNSATVSVFCRALLCKHQRSRYV